jgi:hypothetical protein
MLESTSQTTRSDDRQTWRSLLFGSLIWFLHLNLVYPLTSLSCRWNWLFSGVGNLSALQVVQIVITIIAAVLMLINIYLPWRAWRQFQTDREHVLSQTEQDRRPLMAFVTMLSNSIFFLFIIASFVPILALNPCG